MSKFGVGVGEEFPVDEENRPAPGETAQDGCCDEDWHRRRDMRREAWHRFRQQMRAEWRARRHAMHDELHRRDPIEPMDGFRNPHLHHFVIGALAVIGLAALASMHRHHR